MYALQCIKAHSITCTSGKYVLYAYSGCHLAGLLSSVLVRTVFVLVLYAETFDTFSEGKPWQATA